MMKISIVTICYNSQNTIEATILSILKQKDEGVEFIIVDGGSDDSTLEIIEQYKSYIDLVISEKDRGISDAFNKGINAATGVMIGFINSDDILWDGVIKKIRDSYENGVDIIYGDTMINDTLNQSCYVRKALPLTNMEVTLPFVHQSSFVSKEAYMKWGIYSLDYKICMDYDCFAAMYKNGAKFKYIPEILSEFTYGGTSYSYPWKTMIENIKVSFKHGFSRRRELWWAIKYLVRVTIKRTLSYLGLWKLVEKYVHEVYPSAYDKGKEYE